MAEPRFFKHTAEHRQSDRGQKQQQQRHRLDPQCLENDSPEFNDLSAVAHGIEIVKAMKFIIVNGLRNIKQEQPENTDVLDHTVDPFGENTAQPVDDQRRDKRKQRGNNQSVCPKRPIRRGADNTFAPENIQPEDRQQPFSCKTFFSPSTGFFLFWFFHATPSSHKSSNQRFL